MPEFDAIDLDRVNPDRVTLPGTRPDGKANALPTSPVSLPVADPSTVAVLSWRWDVMNARRTSRNVSIAIAEAQRRGVRHLFMDVVSVDQRLSGDALMQAVVEFSALYEQIPVIAAYDEVGVSSWDWTRIMRRPWILREARALRANPQRIVYVGHVSGQGTDENTGFRHMLGRIWRSSFTHSILHVLCGQVGMHSTSDLRYILPEHASLLSAAHAQMSRHDFLLTAAILAQVPVTDLRLNEDIDLAAVAFDRYTLSPAPGLTYDSNQYVWLDGQRVATWMSHYNLYQDHHRRKLEVAPDAERLIHHALGLSQTDYEQYTARAAERRNSLLVNHGPTEAGANIEVTFAV